MISNSSDTETDIPVITRDGKLSSLNANSGSYAVVYYRHRQSVCCLVISDGSQSWKGSAFYAEANGQLVIVTNYHVVSEGDNQDVAIFEHKVGTARLCAFNEKQDIAVLQPTFSVDGRKHWK